MRPDPDGPPVAGGLPRRTTDRVEDLVAWLLTGAALLVIVIAVLAGVGVQRREAERAALDRTSSSQTSAVLLEDAHVVSGEFGRAPAQVRARWADRGGREHVGVVPVMRSVPAGAGVVVWIDAAGEITSRPGGPASAVIGGTVAAVGVLCAGATPLLVIWLGVRRLTGRYNSRRWEQEWERVEPRWRRTVL
ncbi:Rv1733c family protein [Pseudonocardia adelaidensis]|uniref:Integral membrane protein n=1 Tax=Pseudonocardia adelaidensis TaxID=648754 RepID=A0ABP9NXS9_9PSEU